MEESELKTQFPELYAAIIAKGEALGRQEGMVAGVAQGTEKERKRVQAHLKMAETTGAPQIAHEAIANGKSVLDEDIHAEYMSAALNRADKTARTSDAETALSALAGASKESVGLDFGDQIIAVMNARSEGVR